MGPAFPMAADLLEPVAAAQAMLPLQGLPRPFAIRYRRGQALAALQAAPLDDIATIPGAHALTKTVYAQSPAHLGLESPLSHGKLHTPFFGCSLAPSRRAEEFRFVWAR